MQTAGCPLWVKSRHDLQVREMPALPPKLTFRPRKADVCFVPIADNGLTRPMAQDARPKSKMRDPPTVECC
jgi:hypothetical protein